MQAPNSVIYFPKQQKSASRKSCKAQDKKPKCDVLTWIRNGWQFPGQIAPLPIPPLPEPTPEPEPPKKPGEPEKGGAQ